MHAYDYLNNQTIFSLSFSKIMIENCCKMVKQNPISICLMSFYASKDDIQIHFFIKYQGMYSLVIILFTGQLRINHKHRFIK